MTALAAESIHCGIAGTEELGKAKKLDAFNDCYHLHIVNDKIIACLTSTNETVIMDSNLKELRKVHAIEAIPESWKSISHQLRRKKRIRQPTNSPQILLMNGNYILSTCDPNTGSTAEIPSFWKIQDKFSFGMIVSSDANLSKVAGIGLLENDQTIHLYTSSGNLTSFHKKSVLKSINKLISA